MCSVPPLPPPVLMNVKNTRVDNLTTLEHGTQHISRPWNSAPPSIHDRRFALHIHLDPPCKPTYNVVKPPFVPSSPHTRRSSAITSKRTHTSQLSLSFPPSVFLKVVTAYTIPTKPHTTTHRVRHRHSKNHVTKNNNNNNNNSNNSNNKLVLD